MDVTSAITERRSIRKYKIKDVPEDVLQKVLEAGMLAPSAANRQAWNLIVVNDKKLKEELVPICKNQKFVEECSVFLVAVEDPSQKWSKVDCTIMMDHISLEAVNNGLGTCWIGAFDKDKVGEILKVPEGRSVSVCMTLGYPDEKPEARPRKTAKELVFWNHYGVEH